MNQVWHIFRKDTRHLWPEILVAILLVLAACLAQPYVWKIFHDQQARYRYQILMSLLALLVIVAWWLVTARAVQDESLVGDRQFWITRPYRWDRLMAAKVLFPALWIGVPYYLGELLLLKEAGFRPSGYLLSVVPHCALFSAVLNLPVLALASMTSNLIRLVFSIVGCLAVSVGFGFLSSGPRPYPVYLPYGEGTMQGVIWTILIAGAVAIITLQYAARRVWVSRILFLAVALGAVLVGVTFGRNSLVDRAYPVPSAGMQPVFTVDVPAKAIADAKTRSWGGEDYIDTWVRYAGVASGEAAAVENLRFKLVSPDGTEWQSPWQRTRDYIRPGTQDEHLSLTLNPAVYERFRSGPVTVQVELAVSRYRSVGTLTSPYPHGDAAVGGIGYCAPEANHTGFVTCRTAVHDLPLTYAESVWKKGECGDRAGSGDVMLPIAGWIYNTGLGFPFHSVRTSVLMLNSSEQQLEAEVFRSRADWNVCPGSPLAVTQYQLIERTRVDATIANFRLPLQVQATD